MSRPGLDGDEEELEAMAECLDTASRKYGMEINTDKTNVITGNPTASKMTSILLNDHTLDIVSTFNT